MLLGALGLVAAGLFPLVGCEDKPIEPIAYAPEPQPAEPEPDYYRQLPPGELALVKIDDPALFPDFRPGYDRRSGLERATMHSLEYMAKPSSRQFYPYAEISHDQVVASLEAFLQVLQSAQSADEFDAIIKERFDIYISRGCDDKGTVLFTGYYRPIFDARLQPTAEFRYPLYRQPDDLVKDPVTGAGYRADGSPYYTRGEINNGALAGQGYELCYLRDPFAVYIATVQGSARLRMGDGSMMDIGYVANNGHDYSSIGQTMVDQGLIEPEQLSLQGLIDYFRQHPDQLERITAVNKRYVFFDRRSGGPWGSLNTPVTPFRTIATDKTIYPRASVAFLNTRIPAYGNAGEIRQTDYAGFALDQDTGGAIRAAGRCDLFLGTGPEIGQLAGRTLSEGKLYYIFLKPQMMGRSTAVASPSPTRYEPSPQPSYPNDGPYGNRN